MAALSRHGVLPLEPHERVQLGLDQRAVEAAYSNPDPDPNPNPNPNQAAAACATTICTEDRPRSMPPFPCPAPPRPLLPACGPRRNNMPLHSIDRTCGSGPRTCGL